MNLRWPGPPEHSFHLNGVSRRTPRDDSHPTHGGEGAKLGRTPCNEPLMEGRCDREMDIPTPEGTTESPFERKQRSRKGLHEKEGNVSDRPTPRSMPKSPRNGLIDEKPGFAEFVEFAPPASGLGQEPPDAPQKCCEHLPPFQRVKAVPRWPEIRPR